MDSLTADPQGREPLDRMRDALGLSRAATPESIAFHVECCHADMLRLHREKLHFWMLSKDLLDAMKMVLFNVANRPSRDPSQTEQEAEFWSLKSFHFAIQKLEQSRRKQLDGPKEGSNAGA